jgi:hypothetical protein
MMETPGPPKSPKISNTPHPHIHHTISHYYLLHFHQFNTYDCLWIEKNLNCWKNV